MQKATKGTVASAEGCTRRAVHDQPVLGILQREPWTGLLIKTGMGQVVVTKQHGRDVFPAIAA